MEEWDPRGNYRGSVTCVDSSKQRALQGIPEYTQGIPLSRGAEITQQESDHLDEPLTRLPPTLSHPHGWVTFSSLTSGFLSVHWLDDFSTPFLFRAPWFHNFIGFQELCEVGSAVEQSAVRPWPVGESLVLFFVTSKKFLFKRLRSISSLVLWGSCLFNLSRFLFPSKWYPQHCCCLVFSGSALLQRNENSALLKAQKAKL